MGLEYVIANYSCRQRRSAAKSLVNRSIWSRPLELLKGSVAIESYSPSVPAAASPLQQILHRRRFLFSTYGLHRPIGSRAAVVRMSSHCLQGIYDSHSFINLIVRFLFLQNVHIPRTKMNFSKITHY